MFFQRKLPVSLSSCITLSFGEMMIVSSSISLHARAGFFCHKTEAGALTRGEPPKTRSSCVMSGCSRIFPSPPGLEFQEAAGWLALRRRRKARSAEEREESPRGGALPAGFPQPAANGKFPRREHSYSIQLPGIRPKREFRTRATLHFPGAAGKFHQ